MPVFRVLFVSFGYMHSQSLVDKLTLITGFIRAPLIFASSKKFDSVHETSDHVKHQKFIHTSNESRDPPISAFAEEIVRQEVNYPDLKFYRIL